jgi:hypothetical protein
MNRELTSLRSICQSQHFPSSRHNCKSKVETKLSTKKIDRPSLEGVCWDVKWLSKGIMHGDELDCFEGLFLG